MRILSMFIALFLLFSHYAFAQSTNADANQSIMTMQMSGMFQDVLARVDGKGNVIVKDKESLYKFKLSPEQVSKLIDAYNKNHFSSMPERYPCTTCDSYSEKTTVTLTFNDKKVVAQEEVPAFSAILEQFNSILKLPEAKAAQEAAKNNKSYELIGDYLILMSGNIIYYQTFTPVSKLSDIHEGIFSIPEDKAMQFDNNVFTGGDCPKRYTLTIHSNNHPSTSSEGCLNGELVDLIKQQASTQTRE